MLQNVRRRPAVLKDVTVRDFGGGWNVIDNELNLSSRFAVIFDNVSREEDGSVGVRWGTQQLADIGVAVGMAADDYIVNSYYFQSSVVSILSDGRLTRTLGNGTTSVIWDTSIAAGLVGTPAAWGPTDFASFAVFAGKLIVCNGTDKPLEIDFNAVNPVIYLQDAASGSNVNVPICRYVLAANRYLLMAGDALYPDRVHISNRDTAGTWFGDAAPNDATYVDLGKTGVQGDQNITGLNRYRDQIVVGFLNAMVLGRLGVYNDAGVHVPDFDDVVEGYGCHSHRALVNLGNDLFILDDQGITSLARSLLSGATEPKRASEYIDPEVSTNVNNLLQSDAILQTHAVYNSNDKQYMCFVPNHSEYARATGTDPFEVLQDRTDALRVRIPSHNLKVGDKIGIDGATNWNDVDAATSLNGIDHAVTRVIDEDIIEIEPPLLATSPNKVLIGGGSGVTYTPRWTETIGYIYTFINELKVRAWARYRGWRWRASCRTELGTVVFADDQRLFVYGNANLPLYQDFVGTNDVSNIEFVWEFPWTDLNARPLEKHTRYVQLDTRGDAEFSFMMFTDNIYMIDGQLYPNNQMTMKASDAHGYGGGGQTYGGGRRTRDQRLFDWPARGKLFKMRFQGSIKRPLRLIALTLLYQDGSIRR